MFQEYLWERDGNGYYRVTNKLTGETVTAIPCLGGRTRRYCIRESVETETNYYGQTVPKRYDKFGVMAFCKGRRASGNLHTHMREGFSDA